MRRTTATTDYLKECMGTALLELMKEKPIEKISIEEMTAKADVGRSTYFRYFKSKDEVLSFKIIWSGVGGVCITIIYIVLGNLPFIVVQRYNRPRLQKLFAMQQRKK